MDAAVTAPNDEMLVAEAVHLSLGGRKILRGLDISVPRGELVCLLGPSGCGKTTLLRSIAGLERPDAGVIRIRGNVASDGSAGAFVQPEHRHLGMVFQNYALLPHLSLLKNVQYPMRRERVSSSESRERALRALEMVGLADRHAARPSALSGGQQQRVALARAIVGKPHLLLLDEPLSNLDAHLRVQLRQQIREVHDDLGLTSVYVTHDQAEAGSLADRVGVVLNGKLAELGPPSEVFARPRTREVADFLGYDSSAPAEVVRNAPGRVAAVRLQDQQSVIEANSATDFGVGDRVQLMMRARSFRIAELDGQPTGDFAGTGTVVRLADIGGAMEVVIDSAIFGRVTLPAVPPWEFPDVRPGDEVALSIPPGAAAVVPMTELSNTKDV